MPIKTTVRISSKIFNTTALLKTMDAALEKTANEHIESTKTLITSSVPAGRLYKRRRGFHRASAKGQRPAVDTGHMLSSFRSTKVLRTWVVDVAPRPNPHNGVSAQKYAEILQSDYGKRKIITKKDAKDFEKVLSANVAQEIAGIL